MHWREKARMRPRELAEIASISLSTVKRKLRSGELESYVDGGCRFIPIRAALAFVREDPPAEVATPRLRSEPSPEARALVARIRREVA